MRIRMNPDGKTSENLGMIAVTKIQACAQSMTSCLTSLTFCHLHFPALANCSMFNTVQQRAAHNTSSLWTSDRHYYIHMPHVSQVICRFVFPRDILKIKKHLHCFLLIKLCSQFILTSLISGMLFTGKETVNVGAENILTGTTAEAFPPGDRDHGEPSFAGKISPSSSLS